MHSPPTNYAWHRAAAEGQKKEQEIKKRLLARIDELEKSGISVMDFVNRPD